MLETLNFIFLIFHFTYNLKSNLEKQVIFIIEPIIVFAKIFDFVKLNLFDINLNLKNLFDFQTFLN